jgi:hypothetical protein
VVPAYQIERIVYASASVPESGWDLLYVLGIGGCLIWTGRRRRKKYSQIKDSIVITGEEPE